MPEHPIALLFLPAQLNSGRQKVLTRSPAVCRLRRPELTPGTDMLRNLIYAAHSKTVDAVIVDGQIPLEHGQFVAPDATPEQERPLRIENGFRRMSIH